MDSHGMMSCDSIRGTCLPRRSLSPRASPSFFDVEEDPACPVVDEAAGERVAIRDVFHLIEDYGVISGAKHRYVVEYSFCFGAYAEEPPAPVRLWRDLRPVFSLSWRACPVGNRGSFDAFLQDLRITASDDGRGRKKMPRMEYPAQ